MGSEFLTADEVAEYLRIPLSTVYKMVQDRRLPGFKVGKHWRFRSIKIQNWIKELENNNGSAHDKLAVENQEIED